MMSCVSFWFYDMLHGSLSFMRVQLTLGKSLNKACKMGQLTDILGGTWIVKLTFWIHVIHKVVAKKVRV